MNVRLENQLCFPLYVCAKEAVRQYRKPLEKLGLTYTQYVVLMAFWEYGSMTIEEADQLTRRVQRKVHQETGVILTGVGVYSYNTSDDEAARIRNKIQETVLAHEWALQMHGFYADVEKKILRFDGGDQL
jgi:hypothetical protein